MMGFFNRNGDGIQAMAGVLTVLLAVGALIGVKWQIDAAERIQQAQSARDIYREFLALSANKPEFATPDYCQLMASSNRGAYTAYVEYLIYTAEQVTSVEEGWSGTFDSFLQDHAAMICDIEEGSGYTPQVATLIAQFQAKHCAAVKPCR
jgi:hypothetical protein